MKVSQLAKELGVDYKDVIKDVNVKFNTSIAHYSTKVTEEQAQYIRVKNSDKTKKVEEAVSEESKKVNSWEGMPWDKTERSRTKGHEDWREANPKAWQAYIAYERIQITEEKNKYIAKRRG